MSRYFLVIVLIVFGYVGYGTAQKKPVPMPVVDCVVEHAHGSLGGDSSPQESDTTSLNLNAIDKIRLEFKAKDVTQSGHISHGPFRVEMVKNYELLQDQYLDMRLVSSRPDEQVTIYLSGRAITAGQPPLYFDITIIRETPSSVGVVVLNGTARVKWSVTRIQFGVVSPLFLARINSTSGSRGMRGVLTPRINEVAEKTFEREDVYPGTSLACPCVPWVVL